MSIQGTDTQPHKGMPHICASGVFKAQIRSRTKPCRISAPVEEVEVKMPWHRYAAAQGHAAYLRQWQA